MAYRLSASVEGSRFRELQVYRQAAWLSDELWDAVQGWNSWVRWSVGVQLIRASDSIGANIAEAFGRTSSPDQRRFLFIARGSAHETEHWISVAVGRGLLSNAFEEKVTNVTRTLNGLIRSHKQKS